MNNKGQVLVIFVIVLPIFLTILALVIDLGLFSIEKRKISNNVYDAVECYIKNIDNAEIKEKTTKLLQSNLDDIDIKLTDTNEFIKITVIKEYKGLYTIVSNNQKISITYKGLKQSKKIIKG